GKPAPEYSAGDGNDLRGDRAALRCGSLCGTTDLARGGKIPRPGYGLRLCRGARLETTFPDRRIYPAAGKLRFGHGRADWRGAAAVWHGAQQRPAQVIFWSGG